MFVPGQFDSPNEKMEEVEEEKEVQHPSVTLLYDAMYQLTLEPGRFDSIARKLTGDLNQVIGIRAGGKNTCKSSGHHGISNSGESGRDHP